MNLSSKGRNLSRQRLILLATTTSLAAATLVAGFELSRYDAFTVSVAGAAENARPVGFADIVEKVKPAVVAVRVKMDFAAKSTGLDGGSPFPQNSPMEQFFRRFGMPGGHGSPDSQGQSPNHAVTGQGSGFLSVPTDMP